ncbi:MurR/RpiR family transcriptional regulator [Fervidibacillus albus]|uniref:MurR/RpiR family transcriptional regulator n=1 Tax=Fervidibacillus albus TaxID=2980026 RepID=A0A9E8LU70_9BACI|nr:MurR/RpiR family transcriptional regulator [Fervidibacillus albus]WAA08889.1 MurR/RpiR family transcriptional regulator [Fervidibacillus albus]
MYNFIAKLLNFIESSTDQTKSEIIIAEYILRNVEKIPDMSIYELADACHTSPATITRFCQRFENITFKELKEYARSMLEFNDSEVDFQNLKTNIYIKQVNEYYDELYTSLRQTEQLLRSEEMIQVVREIYHAKKVAFFGVTFSHLIARNAQFKFIRLGKYATAYSNHENQISEANSLTSQDLAVVVSFSGETRFIVQLAKVLKKRRIPIIAITGNEKSFLAQNAKRILKVSSNKMESFKSPILEEINMLSVLNSIYLVYSIVFKNSDRYETN